MKVSQASAAEIPELVSLINSAYRGSDSKQGWTTEADLITGEIRTNESDLSQMMIQPGAIMLKCVGENESIRGCVYLKKKNEKLFLGMLTVSPNEQNAGIGKVLLQSAEKYGLQNDCTRIQIFVINLRIELIAWYEKYGFVATGRIEPFPEDAGFGKPTRPLVLMEMEKNLKA